jgi:hypothetical protein
MSARLRILASPGLMLGVQQRFDCVLIAGNSGRYPLGSCPVISIHEPVISIHNRRRSLTEGSLRAAAFFRFIQPLPNGDQQLGDARRVMKALALGEPPVVLPYRPLITVDERCPDEAPGGQLPPDRAQLGLCRQQKLHSQMARQPFPGLNALNVAVPAFVMVRYATPIEYVQALAEGFLSFLTMELEFWIGDHFKRHAEPVPAAVEAGILLPVDRVQPQRLHMKTADIVELGKLISGNTSANATGCTPF